MTEPAPQCFTCGNNIKDVWDDYYKRYDEEMAKEKKEGADPEDDRVQLYVGDKVLDELEYRRMCCRRMFLGDTRKLREVLKLYLTR